jgi:hypothetical protein
MPKQRAQSKLQEHIERHDKISDAMALDIKTIKENHLAHIQASMAAFEANLEWLKWGIMLIIGGIVALYFKQ